jgi:hypothetical protein
MCAHVDNQRSSDVVIARLRLSVQSLLHQHRDLHQSTHLYLVEDWEPSSGIRFQVAREVFLCAL